jgi:hypothetical protein
MSSLLEEAIVDAKALKDAALKNAETAVLEKYSVEVRGALSTLLEQDELGLDEDSPPDADMSFTDDVPYAFQNEELDAPPESELIEIDFDQLKARLDEESEVVESEDLVDATALADDIALEEGNALEDTETQMMKTSAEDASAIAAGEGGEAKEELEEEVDEDIAITEEILDELIEELVVDMTPRPQGWSSLGSADNSIEQANNDAMGAAQDAHLEEEEELENVRTAPDVMPDAELFETKISQITESNKELRALLMESRRHLTRLNLENAKLVYQNKALNSASLNERQKTKIVEAVQSATSVEEARVIFDTIQNAVSVSSFRDQRPQTLREAVQRPTSLLLNSKRNNDEATKDPKMGRMLRLAGLTKQ